MVKEKQAKTTEEHEDISKYYTFSTEKLQPPSQRSSGSGKYRMIVNVLAQKNTTGNIKINAEALGLKTKSIYPSLAKVIESIARLNGVDTKDSKVFKAWRDSNLRLRMIDSSLHVEKLTAKPLQIEEPKRST